MDPIPFNKASTVGRESAYIEQVVRSGRVGGDGQFTTRCAEWLQQQLGVPKVFLTTSCTASLEISLMLSNVGPGDEVILPSFTFVSTANAIARTGATPVFVDISSSTLNLDQRLVEAAITTRTRAIIPVHYAGVACEMNTLCRIANDYQLIVIEDAAQAIDAYYRNIPLGTMGSLGCLSFHETKNASAGQGGALIVNDPQLIDRAEIIRDKGTDRKRYDRGEVRSYSWVDLGSAYVPSELNCAYLLGQLEQISKLGHRRREICHRYQEWLQPWETCGRITLPRIPPHCQSNHHIFFILMRDEDDRDGLIQALNDDGIQAVFHYSPLHLSPYGCQFQPAGAMLPVTESVSQRIVRLPLFYDLSESQQVRIVESVNRYLEADAKPRRSQRLRSRNTVLG